MVTVVIPAMVTVVMMVAMGLDHDRLVDVNHGREGIHRLGSLGASGAEADRANRGASENEEFTHK